jgi:FkbM family methyltransferase
MPTSPINIFGIAGRRVAHLGNTLRRTIGMVSQIEAGPAKGMRFDAGSETLRFCSGQYEPPVQQAIASVVRRGDVCYDIGANLGFFSLLFSRLAGAHGTVYAFEPVPTNADIITGNARLNNLQNVKVLRIALCQADGEAELLLARHIGGAALKTACIPPDLVGSLRVRTAAVDTLVDHQEIDPPNVVKIDVEGAELDVLHGMKHVIGKWAPNIILEVDDETAERCERKLFLCESYLHHSGYQTKTLTNSYADGKWFVRHLVARSKLHTG